jgi:diguanylate cyclase (GGDEF)-like protein
MFRVIECVASEHERWLLLLAVLVCIATTLTSFVMYTIAHASTGRRRFMWAALTGVSAGAGIWATHFVAMLAYKGSLPTSYEPVSTTLSLLIAMSIAAIGFIVATGRSVTSPVLGGVIIGLSISCMHYFGMTALVIPGTVVWDTQLVAASIVLGTAGAAGSLVAFHLMTGKRAIVSAGILLTLAICTLHFTAMGAVTIQPDPLTDFHASGLNRAHLALVIAAVTFIVLLSVYAAAIVQRATLRYEDALRRQNTLLEAAMRYLPVGLSMFDGEQRLIMCNPAYRNLYGVPHASAPAGAHYTEIVAGLVPGKRHRGAADLVLAEYLSKLDCGQTFSEIVELEDGRTITKKVGPIAGGGWVDVHEDITESVRREAKIAHMARHDPLTGLPNRAHLMDAIDAALRNAAAERRVVVHFIDLDRFKQVNDQLGHLMGDDLLKAVAARLRDTVREDDLVARMGGDEFVVMQKTPQPTNDAPELAARIVAALAAPFQIDGCRVDIGASVGIAIAPEASLDCTSLLARADAALYQSKAAGGTGYCIYGDRRKGRALVVYTLPASPALTA